MLSGDEIRKVAEIEVNTNFVLPGHVSCAKTQANMLNQRKLSKSKQEDQNPRKMHTKTHMGGGRRLSLVHDTCQFQPLSSRKDGFQRTIHPSTLQESAL